MHFRLHTYFYAIFGHISHYFDLVSDRELEFWASPAPDGLIASAREHGMRGWWYLGKLLFFRLALAWFLIGCIPAAMIGAIWLVFFT